MKRRMDEETDGRIDTWMDEETDGLREREMDEQRGTRTDGWMDFSLNRREYQKRDVHRHTSHADRDVPEREVPALRLCHSAG